MLKNEVLMFLEQNQGEIISGGDLSRYLNVSRTAVWKAVNALKCEGYAIISHSNEGYRLSHNSDELSEYKIRKGLKTNIIGNKIEILKTVSSTNSYIKDIQNNSPNGMVVVAEEQTSGRGRMNRSFFSPAKKGIYMSILLFPEINITDINLITVLSAVAVAYAIQNITGISPSIKWINDILYQDKKLCGILTEASIEGESGRVSYIVIGIGINISTLSSEFPNEIKDIAVSINEITNKNCFRNALISEILNRIEEYYLDLTERGNKKEFIKRYKEKLCILGQDIEIIQGNKHKKARAIDIDENAGLIVLNELGELQTLGSGEISIKKTIK